MATCTLKSCALARRCTPEACKAATNRRKREMATAKGFKSTPATASSAFCAMSTGLRAGSLRCHSAKTR